MAPFWHRWSYFSILNLSLLSLIDKFPLISALKIHRRFYFPPNRKTPETLRFRGILRLDTCTLRYSIYIIKMLCYNYSITVATRPDPTVRPPSRIAKVRPWLIAIGWISSIVISMLSPGMHISVPSGRLQTPVTSVVLK